MNCLRYLFKKNSWTLDINSNEYRTFWTFKRIKSQKSFELNYLFIVWNKILFFCFPLWEKAFLLKRNLNIRKPHWTKPNQNRTELSRTDHNKVYVLLKICVWTNFNKWRTLLLLNILGASHLPFLQMQNFIHSIRYFLFVYEKIVNLLK